MSTIIELYVVSYFLVAFLMQLVVKNVLVTKATFWKITIFSLIFCAIKFVQDYFGLLIGYQILICSVYICLGTIFVHKQNHISKLAQSIAVCVFYYLCLQGLMSAISTWMLGQNNYISNQYLANMLGTNLIIYCFACVAAEKLKNSTKIKLMHQCSLKLGKKLIKFNGFLDTGNRLTDTPTGLPVVVVNLQAIKKYLSSTMYADILFATNASRNFNSVHKLHYATVSGTSYMTVFVPSDFVVSGKHVKVAVGVSTQNCTDHDALLNVACASISR